MANKYNGEFVLLYLVLVPKQYELLRLTVSLSSLYVATAVRRFIAWFPILFFDTIPRQSTTLASYPNVRTRALGILDDNRV